jgi:hypothetical protein
MSQRVIGPEGPLNLRLHVSEPLPVLVDDETKLGPATGMLPGAEGVGSREIRRVSRREISQAGRDALAFARLAILETPPTQQLHPGPCNFPGSCNPSVMRSYFAPA